MKATNARKFGIGAIVVLLVVSVSFTIHHYIDTPSNVETFSGTVTAVNNGCDVDGICSVTVAGKNIVTAGGLTANAADDVYGASDRLKVGDKAAVKAVHSSVGYTLEGCKACYVRRQ